MSAQNPYGQGAPQPVQLTDGELELIVIALAELTVERRRFAAFTRAADPKAATNALTEMIGAGVLGNRLSLEHIDRQTKQGPFALKEQCDGCGALEGFPHASDCDRVQP